MLFAQRPGIAGNFKRAKHGNSKMKQQILNMSFGMITVGIMLFYGSATANAQLTCPAIIDGGSLPEAIVCERKTCFFVPPARSVVSVFGCANRQSGLPNVSVYGDIASLPSFVVPWSIDKVDYVRNDEGHYTHVLFKYTIRLLRNSVGRRSGHLLVTAPSGGSKTLISVSPSPRANACLDANGDSEITGADGILIARYLLGVRGESLKDGQMSREHPEYDVESHLSDLVE